MRKIYIASPYTIGDVAVNVKRQMDAADDLMNLGFIPFWPLHSHFLHMAHPRPYQEWINVDMAWLESCDALLRLPGDSAGADAEVGCAKMLGMPVFYSLEELVNGLS